jgi:hypothetical protein
LSPGIRAVEREKGLVFDSIKLYGNDHLIADYSKEYLNEERKRVAVINELWVAYDEGLVLIPEEFHGQDKWKKYIEILKSE